MKAACPRLFEAEATRDGRLAGAERASFERHAKTCSVCARELLELERLGETLRAHASNAADELHARRERTRLLATFDRDLLAARDGGAARRRLVAAAVSMAVLAGVVVVCRARPWAARPVHVEASSAVVHADPATAWSERVEGDREVVDLDHGALSIRVDHATSTRRLVVVLPDGELEDTGTTFTVSADDGRTTRVAVQEGSVVLRLRGRPSATVRAGGVWTPAAPPAIASACASSTPSREPAPPPLPRSPRPAAQPPRAATSSGFAHDPSLDLVGPMAALDRGDNTAAADGFARFLRGHPSDPRAEDAAYLCVIALQRSGDRDGTRAAATEYLRRYPAGFRRAEVETLSQ
jgi:hypothetical protein